MSKATIAASGAVAELRELVEAAQTWHHARWDQHSTVTLDKAVEALPPSVGESGPVTVLDLDAIRPALLRAKTAHEGIIIQAMNSPIRTGRCDGSCGWCKLPQAWRDWAEADWNPTDEVPW